MNVLFWGCCHAFDRLVHEIDRLTVLGCDLMWPDEVMVVTKFRLHTITDYAKLLAISQLV